jgi:hypothetical protein
VTISVPYLPEPRLRQVADEFLRQHHPGGDIPIPIEKIVEFKLRLDIVPVPGLMNGFHVDAFITSDLTEIRVDRFIMEHRPNRYRFSLAHEVAHLLIHRDVFAQLKFSTIREWKDTIRSVPADQYRWVEWQAYALAGLILVPTRPLHELFSDKVAEAQAAGVDLRSIRDESAQAIVESNLAKFFEVSAEVIKRRLNREKLWCSS